MFIAFGIFGFIGIVLSSTVLAFIASSTRAEVTNIDAAYADSVFRSVADAFWSHSMPIRMYVALFGPVPPTLRTVMWPIRFLCLLYVASVFLVLLGLAGDFILG